MSIRKSRPGGTDATKRRITPDFITAGTVVSIGGSSATLKFYDPLRNAWYTDAGFWIDDEYLSTAAPRGGPNPRREANKGPSTADS